MRPRTHKWHGEAHSEGGCLCGRCGIRTRWARRQAKTWRPITGARMVEVEEFSFDKGVTWKTLREISGAALTRPKCGD